MKIMKPASIDTLLIHTSVSKWGGVSDIDQWHRDRGFEMIGYHKVIGNQFPTYDSLKTNKPKSENDGKVHEGRSLQYVGAHCPGYNTRSIGICLIGKDGVYTAAQLASLKALCVVMMRKFKISPESVLGHCETANGKSQGKTCPDLDMAKLRAELKSLLA